MKKIFYISFWLFTFNTISAQVVISEFLYNDPGYGVDSIEFIELYNHTNTSIDLTDYTFTDGVTFTFPNFTLQAQSYIVICKFPDVMNKVFGIAYSQMFAWSDQGSIALNNSGEIIQFSDNMGNIIDEFEYSADVNWYSFQTDGWGWALEICDPLIDNSIGQNWQPSTSTPYQYTGEDPFITGLLTEFDVFATPGYGCFVSSTNLSAPNSSAFSFTNISSNFIEIYKDVKVYNLNGKLIVSNFKGIINTSSWPKGMYLFKTSESAQKVMIH